MIDHGEAHMQRTGRPLFSSHMIDLSAEPLETNIAECAAVLRRMAVLMAGVDKPECRIDGVIIRFGFGVREAIWDHAAIHVSSERLQNLAGQGKASCC